MASTPGTLGMGLVGPVNFYLADGGGANKVYFVGASAPYPVPQPEAEYSLELYTMRRGVTSRGFRTAQIDGADVGYQDLEFDVITITPAMKLAMDLKYYAFPPIDLEFSFDGVTLYQAVFQKNGWKPSNWDEAYQNQSGKIKIHILSQLN